MASSATVPRLHNPSSPLAWRDESDSWHMLMISVITHPAGKKAFLSIPPFHQNDLFSSEQTFPCGLKSLWNQPEGPRVLRQWGRVVSYMCFAKGLEVALYGGDTRGSVSSVRGRYWVSPLWLIPLFRTLGNSRTSPPSCPTPPQIPRKNKTLQNNLQLRWVLHTVPFSPLCFNLSTSLPSLLPSQLSVCVLGQQASGQN